MAELAVVLVCQQPWLWPQGCSAPGKEGSRPQVLVAQYSRDLEWVGPSFAFLQGLGGTAAYNQWKASHLDEKFLRYPADRQCGCGISEEQGPWAALSSSAVCNAVPSRFMEGAWQLILKQKKPDGRASLTQMLYRNQRANCSHVTNRATGSHFRRAMAAIPIIRASGVMTHHWPQLKPWSRC